MPQDVALVTGASSGIGAALARRLARDGRHLLLVARRRDRLETLAGELRAAHGVDAHVLAVDLAKPEGPAAVAREATSRGLAVDWLVNNAGFGTNGRFDRLPLEGELEEIRLNVEALVALTGLFVPAMVQRGRGAVLNVASVAGMFPSAYMATYAATKAFVISFSEAIATELRGTGVDVLCVCPGFTRTEFQDVAQVDASKVPSMAWMSAEEVADQAVRGMGRGPVLVNGVMNTLGAALLRHVPHGPLLRLTAAVMKPS